MDLFLNCIVKGLIIIILELLLSIDNVVVIANIARRVPLEQRPKVLLYGMLGAYVFRGLFLFSLAILLEWQIVGDVLKLFGGLWLIKMGWSCMTPEPDSIEEGNTSFIDGIVSKIGLSLFVLTIIEVEVLDIVFSMDNILAAVSLGEGIKGEIFGFPAKMVTIIISVFIGIALMRVVANKVTVILDKYPQLMWTAGVVILILGLKLIVGALISIGVYLNSGYIFVCLKEIMESHWTDFVFSLLSLGLFTIPFIKKTPVQ